MWPFLRKRNVIDIETRSMNLVRMRNIQIGNVAGGGANTAALAFFIYICVSHSLNVGYLILFGLSSLIVISSHLGAAALTKMEIGIKPIQLIEAGKISKLILIIKSKSKRSDLEAYTTSGDFANLKDFDLEGKPSSTQELPLQIMMATRGVHRAPGIILQTRKPIGMMRCYVKLMTEEKIFVHPSPEKNPPSLRTAGLLGEEISSKGKDINNQPGGLKNYQPGDPLKLFSWKLFAKTNANVLATKVPDIESSAANIHLTLDAAVDGGDIEAGLERLTAWLFEADKSGFTYSMNIPGTVRPKGKGQEHLNECLKSLAEFNTNQANEH